MCKGKSNLATVVYFGLKRKAQFKKYCRVWICLMFNATPNNFWILTWKFYNSQFYKKLNQNFKNTQKWTDNLNILFQIFQLLSTLPNSISFITRSFSRWIILVCSEKTQLQVVYLKDWYSLHKVYCTSLHKDQFSYVNWSLSKNRKNLLKWKENIYY